MIVYMMILSNQCTVLFNVVFFVDDEHDENRNKRSKQENRSPLCFRQKLLLLEADCPHLTDTGQ